MDQIVQNGGWGGQEGGLALQGSSGAMDGALGHGQTLLSSLGGGGEDTCTSVGWARGSTRGGAGRAGLPPELSPAVLRSPVAWGWIQRAKPLRCDTPRLCGSSLVLGLLVPPRCTLILAANPRGLCAVLSLVCL